MVSLEIEGQPEVSKGLTLYNVNNDNYISLYQMITNVQVSVHIPDSRSSTRSDHSKVTRKVGTLDFYKVVRKK